MQALGFSKIKYENIFETIKNISNSKNRNAKIFFIKTLSLFMT